MQILKFNLKGDFAFFKDKITFNNNISYPCIHKPSILGLLGSILGKSGFSDFKEKKSIEYLSYFDNKLEVSIVINNPIKYIENTINDSTSLNINSIQGRGFQFVENVLEDVSYDIYIKSDDDIIFNELYEVLSNYNFYFEPNLGKSYFHANISSVELVKNSSILNYEVLEEMASNYEKDSLYINSLFPLSLVNDDVDYEEDYITKRIDSGSNFKLPISSNKNNGQYNSFFNFSYKNYVLIDNIIENKSNFNIIDEQVVYFV